MHLPDLNWQFLYGRLAWGIVLASMLVALWPRRYALSRGAIGLIVAGMVALQALPGAASPTYWLALACQSPSGFLAGLCLARLYQYRYSGRAHAIMTPTLAGVLAGFGALLYLDAIGLLSAGVYYWGFSPYAPPALALLLAAGSAAALARGQFGPQAFALLLALMGFSILRLPTGNIWDALLDPLLWAWALATLSRHALRRWKNKRRLQASTAPAREPDLEHEGIVGAAAVAGAIQLKHFEE